MLAIGAGLRFFAMFVRELVAQERQAAEKANESNLQGMREMMAASSNERLTAQTNMAKERELWQMTIQEHTLVFKSMLELNTRVIQKVEALIDLNQTVLDYMRHKKGEPDGI